MYNCSLKILKNGRQHLNTWDQFKKYLWKGKQYSTAIQRDSRISKPDYKTTVKDCMPTFYNLVTELTKRSSEEPVEFSKRLNEILLYNVPRGKRVRVRTIVTAYKILESPQNLTVENVQLAYILGWCIEMLNSSILINDDIMDASMQRRGAPCWYLVKGLRAINDAQILENAVFEVLKTHLRYHPSYKAAIELFDKTSHMTCLGQSLDTFRPYKNENYSMSDFYTVDKYNAIVKYKTLYYTLELPMLLALHLSNKYDKNNYEQMRSILTELSYFFQVQNDFNDCFGDALITGKEGSDIQEGKCTWLIVKALQKVTPSQKTLLEQNYGKANSESVRKVLNLYEELDIPNMYYNYQNNIETIISLHTDKISHIFPSTLFTSITDIVCKSVFQK